ncbi:GNAT family N-acetyltransferase [Streptomyces sp. NPDC002054]|uniref:GNAT family N-acetyltransferase n=1 Tax=Streptomyces sp. NPDC002054 TaxID=3154663 RepID=UPI00332C30E1
MTWTFTRDLTAYLTTAGPAVAAQPVVNTLLLTVADALERRGPGTFGDGSPRFGWWTGPDGSVAGGLVCTPPYPLVLGALPEQAVRELGAALDSEPLLAGLSGFNARRADAELLAAAWGRPAKVEEELRLHRLEELLPPDPAPAGRARPAVEADLPLLLDWLTAYTTELGEPAPPTEAALRDRMGYQGIRLWEDAGVPVSLASFSPVLGGAARVGPVYTPPELRGRGYAAGVTHAATVAAQALGAAEVLLFTDLANPTSNGIYGRLGYRPVEDRVILASAG